MAGNPARLVGRDRELRQIRSTLDRVGPNALIAVEIIGESGIGKTALMDRLVSEAEDRGLLCLRATGSAAEQDFSFGVLAALLDDACATDSAVAALDPHTLADLASVLPGLRSLANAPSTGSPVDPLLVCHSTRRAVAALAGRRGLLLAVDDLQWVDEMTASVIAFWLRHGVEAPVLIATARRTGPPSARPTRTHPGSERIHTIELAPITAEEGSLLLQHLPAAQRGSVLHAAGGNPFFITQMATHVPAQRGTTTPSRDLGAHPPAVAAAILTDLSELTRPAQHLAQAGAVLGDPFDVTLAGQVGELAQDEALRAVDELAEASLVVPVNAHGTFQFRHPIIGDVIYDGLMSGWRLAAHARAAKLLVERGSDTLAVARQLEYSAQVGDLEAVDVIHSAALETRALLPRTAGRLLAAAVRLTPAAPQAPDRRSLLAAERADCLINSGQFDVARSELLESLDLVPSDDYLARAFLIANLTRVENWVGLRHFANDRIRATIGDLPEEAAFARLLLEILLLSQVAVAGSAAELQANGPALAQATVGLPGLEFSVEVLRAYGETRTGRTDKAREHAVQADQLLAATPDDQLVAALESLILLSSAEEWLESWDQVLQHARHGIVLAKNAGNLTAGVWLRVAAGSALGKMGRLKEAAEISGEAEELARIRNDPALIGVTLARRSAAAGLLGEHATACALAQESEAHLELVRDSGVRAIVAFFIAPVLLDANKPEDCSRLLVESAGGQDMPEIAGPTRARVFEILTEADLARGDTEGARAWAARAVADAGQIGLPLSTCSAERATAAVLLADGRPEEAGAHALAAIEAADSAGAPVDAARARILAGQALTACGRRDEAKELLKLAEEVLHDCGARTLAAQAAQELRSLGVRRSGKRAPRGATGIASLSTREREVAELVSDGLSNPQIAAQLFLSRRTVESHLARIFSKLSTSSREEVAEVIRRERIVASAGTPALWSDGSR